MTKVPRAFIDELDNYSVPQLFKEFSKKTQLNVIVAKEDKVLGKTDFNYLTPTADLLLLPGDHNFSGQARPGLMSKLQKIFS